MCFFCSDIRLKYNSSLSVLILGLKALFYKKGQGAKMRGAGLSSQEEGVGRPLQTQFQRPVLTGSGLGHSRQGRSPTAETVGRVEARPVLLEQQQF